MTSPISRIARATEIELGAARNPCRRRQGAITRWRPPISTRNSYGASRRVGDMPNAASGLNRPDPAEPRLQAGSRPRQLAAELAHGGAQSAWHPDSPPSIAVACPTCSLPPPALPPDYDAHSIEVLEGLEPVRRRPGMYIGGTDERALHHLAAEVLDNAWTRRWPAMPRRIEVTLEAGNRLTITDNGRGIPIDEHPKYPGKSALEVILTTLHSGGKFSDKAYATSGGLHGVGVSRGQRAVERDDRRGGAQQASSTARPSRAGVPTSTLERDRRRPRTGAARPSPSPPTPRFSARTRSSSRRGSTGSRAPRPICSPASRSAGAAIRR